MRTLIASLVLVSALGGCAGKTQDAPPAGDAEAHVIRGNAWYRERIKIAPGADFTVQLIDDQLADSQAAVIASSTHEDVAGPPYEFALSYDPAKLRPNGHYSVGANLRGADGNLLFVSERRAPMTPGANAGVEIMMVRVPGPGEAPAPPARIEHSRWTCDGMTFEAHLDIPGERVELMLPEGTLSLPLAQSASGARYADHRGNEFWTKGDTGTLTREGGRKVDCVRADAKVPPGN